VGIALGSASQIALFVAPVLVLLSYVIGPAPMHLQFWPGAVVMMLIATMTASLVTNSGRSAWFVGVLVLIVYLIFAMTLYLLPPRAPREGNIHRPQLKTALTIEPCQKTGWPSIATSLGSEPMLRQYLVGAAVSVCNIAIHALVMVTVIRVTRIASEIATPHPALRLVAVMIAAVSALMVAHFGEVLVWSLTYAIVGAAPADTDLIYFAFVNYTTLGYGDVTPVERWRLLGPMTAMNGVLLFGWSTAVIFEVLRKAMYPVDGNQPNS
jgi:Ca2+/Na+ antiporter